MMKDTALYLEADEDITSAIDKLKKFAGDRVEIVVPKRSTLLQSVINQRLLKKAAADAGKELVLVTGDRVAGELAARVGLAVAPSVGAKAILSEAAEAKPTLADDVIDESDPEPPPLPVTPPPSIKSEPVASRPEPSRQAPVMTQREVSDDEPEAAEAVAATGAAVVAAKKTPKVPNFSKFQRQLMWGGGVVALVIAYFVAMYYLTTAKVNLAATGTTINVATAFTVNPNLSQSDLTSATLDGQSLTTSHNLSTTFTPTGTQDVGTKAGGNITVTNNSGSSQTLVAGTRFQAPDGNIFVSNSDVTVPGATASVDSHGNVIKKPGTASVAVTASANGDKYNEGGGQRYTIPGLDPGQQALVYGTGDQMSGGTTKTITVVSQDDVTKATTAALDGDKAAGIKALKAQVASGDQLLDASVTMTPDNVTSNPAVGSQGNQATLTLTASYTALAVKKDDLANLLQKVELKQLGSDQQVYDNGLGSAQIASKPGGANGQNFNLTTTASGGAKLDIAAITKAIEGKKVGDATQYVQQLPDVQGATIALSPPWATKLPHIGGHIKINITVNKD